MMIECVLDGGKTWTEECGGEDNAIFVQSEYILKERLSESTLLACTAY